MIDIVCENKLSTITYSKYPEADYKTSDTL